MKTTYFMVRDKGTGLYSTGGSFPNWAAKGKKWSKRGFITSHISNSVGWPRAKDFYKNAEVVAFEYEPLEVSTTPLIQVINEKQQEREEQSKRHATAEAARKYRAAQDVVRAYEQTTKGPKS